MLLETEISDYANMLNSTIQRRKSERGKNYNPKDPENQQVELIILFSKTNCSGKINTIIHFRPHLEELPS